VSLPVADIAASIGFYTTLGFEQTGGDVDENWVIMRNGTSVVGLFQGMFDQPILTFNPGFDQHMRPLDDFIDVREIQSRLVGAGVDLVEATDPGGTGPAHIVLSDPDGHRVMVDQFGNRPGTASDPDQEPH
jgi:catechol 2,3-dioxygenase-like lactoylglutathione lyase family enzyme